jgi:hypothetical protein
MVEIRYLQEKLAEHPDVGVGFVLFNLGKIADTIDRDVRVRKEDLMESADSKFVEVYRARNVPEAHLMRNALEEAGIRVQIEGELLQGGVGDLPPGWPTAPRILVEESQLATARQIVEQLENKGGARSDDQDEKEQTRCLACGAIIEEGEAKCPSCGWSYQGQGDA